MPRIELVATGREAGMPSNVLCSHPTLASFFWWIFSLIKLSFSKVCFGSFYPHAPVFWPSDRVAHMFYNKHARECLRVCAACVCESVCGARERRCVCQRWSYCSCATEREREVGRGRLIVGESVCACACVREQRETNVASWTVFNFSTAWERECVSVRKRERERERGRVAEERKEERGRVGGRGAKQSEALLDFVHFFVFLVGPKIPPFRCFYAVELFSGVQTLGALRVSSVNSE